MHGIINLSVAYPYPCRCWLYLCYWILGLAYADIYYTNLQHPEREYLQSYADLLLICVSIKSHSKMHWQCLYCSLTHVEVVASHEWLILGPAASLLQFPNYSSLEYGIQVTYSVPLSSPSSPFASSPPSSPSWSSSSSWWPRWKTILDWILASGQPTPLINNMNWPSSSGLILRANSTEAIFFTIIILHKTSNGQIWAENGNGMGL